MAKAKLIFPPFVWLNAKSGVQEDRYHQRWTVAMRRTMRHGNYKWNEHTESSV